MVHSSKWFISLISSHFVGMVQTSGELVTPKYPDWGWQTQTIHLWQDGTDLTHAEVDGSFKDRITFVKIFDISIL